MKKFYKNHSLFLLLSMMNLIVLGNQAKAVNIERNITNKNTTISINDEFEFTTGFHLEEVDIIGIVTDQSGAPLPGVNVFLKENRSVGTTTDLNGKYVLTVPEDGNIIFSMIGFEEQEIPVSGKTKIDVILEPSKTMLDETVVVGFGKQKKEDVVGSVTSVRPEDLKIPSSNLTTALAGNMAGMIAYQRSGEPGEDNAQFFIRGVTTFGYKQDPLILVDGIEFTSTDLARLQVDDIESFSILKDATATAVYGARGANGVILIETKTGTEGKAKVSLRVENSISSPTKNVKFADPIEYMRLNNEAIRTRDPLGVTPYSQRKIDNTMEGNPLVYPSNNWRDLLFKEYSNNQRVNLNIKGGGKVARYYLASTFNNDNGLLKVDHRNNFNNNIDLKTYELRSNVDISITKSTEIGVKLYGTFDDYTGPLSGGSHFYRLAVRSDPVAFPPYFPEDDDHLFTHHILFGGTDDGLVNPYAELVSGYKQYSRSLILAQFNIKQDLAFITKGLRIDGLFNTNRRAYFDVSRSYKPFYYNVGFYDRIDDTYTLTPLNEDEGTEFLGYSEGDKEVKTETYIQGRLNYDRDFGAHSLSGLLVFILQNRLTGNAGSLESSLAHRNIGLSGRFSYINNKKYYAEFDFGYNGSERFYKTNRFGFFPSMGVAWKVSNEPFFDGLKKTVTNLKLRATYGLIGNDDIGPASDRFFYLSDVNMNEGGRKATFGIDNGYSRNGISVNRYSNTDIRWEKSYKTNIGFDLNLFNDIEIIADLWKEHRRDILMTRSDIPTTAGIKSIAIPKANVGEAEGKGVDISLDYSKFITNNFWIKLRGNFTYALSKFLKIEEPDYKNSPWLSKVGYPITQNWGYIAERLFVDDKEVANSPTQSFGVQPMAGDIKYRDVNNDGKVSELDQVPIGYPTTPEVVYGFGASVGFSNFDLSFFFQGLGRESFWINTSQTSPFVISDYSGNLHLKNQMLEAYARDHWSETNGDLYALWPRLSPDINDNNNQRSTWFLRNGSFLRLKNVEIGYTFPKHVISRLYLENLRIYASGINLMNFSTFKLWDIEMAGNGLDYPVQRVINFGVQLSF